jgi:ribosome-binding protein aMBF1 (putative translation factor)
LTGYVVDLQAFDKALTEAQKKWNGAHREEYDNKHRKCEFYNFLKKTMVTNELFRQCLSAIPLKQRAEFDLAYSIAERLDAVLKKKGITQHELARRMGKRDSEVSKWLTGRHNFTTSTIARIEEAIGDKLILISK